MHPPSPRDALDDPYRNGDALRSWIGIMLALLLVLGGGFGWLWHKVERLEDADQDIRNVQSLRSSEIAVLQSQLRDVQRELGDTMQQHHDIEQELMRKRP